MLPQAIEDACDFKGRYLQGRIRGTQQAEDSSSLQRAPPPSGRRGVAKLTLSDSSPQAGPEGKSGVINGLMATEPAAVSLSYAASYVMYVADIRLFRSSREYRRGGMTSSWE